MTIEEKREAIRNYCHDRDCKNCVLFGAECFDEKDTDQQIEEKYKLIMEQQKEEATSRSMVDHPEHYKHGLFETIEEMLLLFSKEEVIAFCKINAYKYKARAPFKGNMDEDLKKADWYLAKVKELEES